MPRIYDSTNDPLDFCALCWLKFCPTEAIAIKRFHGNGVGPDDRGDCWAFDAEHPDYQGEEYVCSTCGRELVKEDNHEPTMQGSTARPTQSD